MFKPILNTLQELKTSLEAFNVYGRSKKIRKRLLLTLESSVHVIYYPLKQHRFERVACIRLTEEQQRKAHP